MIRPSASILLPDPERDDRLPSVIDAKPYDRTPQHKQRAREVADKIIAKFKLKAKNPY
jgi:hypothetical protein